MTRPRHLREIIVLSCALAAPPWAAQAQTPEIGARPKSSRFKPGPVPRSGISHGVIPKLILGMVGAMPDGLKWNKDYLAELLDGARAIVMPPRPSIGLFEGAWFLLTNGSKFSLPRGQSLEAILPADIEPRFAALREKLGKSVEHYRTDTPLRAALRVQEDVTDKLDLTRSEPRDTIRRLASSLNSWLHAVPDEVDAAEAAAGLVAEILTLVAQSHTNNEWGSR